MLGESRRCADSCRARILHRRRSGRLVVVVGWFVRLPGILLFLVRVQGGGGYALSQEGRGVLMGLELVVDIEWSRFRLLAMFEGVTWRAEIDLLLEIPESVMQIRSNTSGLS